MASQLEEYSLSSGSLLYYLLVPEATQDCRWLVGRTLEVAEVEDRPPDAAEQAAPADGRADADFSESTFRGPAGEVVVNP